MLIKDAVSQHWVYKYLPLKLIAYAQLARLDRPVGSKLLLWPCLISLYLAFVSPININYGDVKLIIYYTILFFIGSVAMRGAGCTLNDLVDINIDKKVDRTKNRPLANGNISKIQAIIFMFLQCFVGLLVLLQFNRLTIYIAFSSLLFTIIYPFMKRITYFPQFFLGIAFNWGCFLGWSSIKNDIAIPVFWLYLGCIFWTIGFDTIYAYQDIDDDKKLGIGSTALLFRDKGKFFVTLCYSIFIAFIIIAYNEAKVPYFAYIGIIAASLHLLWQVKNFDIKSPELCLKVFIANSKVGAILCLGLILAYGYNFLLCHL